jgi:hypothetical protein
MLIDAVDQRAVEIEKKKRFDAHGTLLWPQSSPASV